MSVLLKLQIFSLKVGLGVGFANSASASSLSSLSKYSAAEKFMSLGATILVLNQNYRKVSFTEESGDEEEAYLVSKVIDDEERHSDICGEEVRST